ncbi:MAG: transglycosylase domain-containing protein [Clostridia bacterium]|nr:transglycosylase domain-containing protein [Clostridia bacterium]
MSENKNAGAENQFTGKKEQRIANNAEKKRAKMEKKANRKPMSNKLKAVIIGVAALVLSGILTVAIVGINVFDYVIEFKNGPIATNLEAYKSQQYETSIVYGFNAKGKKIELARLHGEENRVWVDIEDIPENLQWAFVCLEDKRFYDHGGVDWLRTFKVLITNSTQGGSTITQQLIKNLTKQNQVTYVRKFNEITRALNMEKNYEKPEILEAYLNTVYLGAGCYGVKTAAETYFGKELNELTIAECALLAGITKNPYANNPYTNMDKAIGRQKYCLDCMLAEGKISQKQYNKASEYEIKLASKSSSANKNENTEEEKSQIYNWYVDFVIDEVIADLRAEYGYDLTEASQQVFQGGLTIEAACDMDVQKKVEKIYANRKGFPSASKDKYGKLPESAITIMDYQGRVVAIVGGTGKKTGNRLKNKAATTYRQPGSSIKPLSIYAPGIDIGYITSSSTTLLDQCITLKDGKDWPKNYNGDYGSGTLVTVESALCRSLNTVPARFLSETLGVGDAYKYATDRFHLNHLTANDKDLSPLAVGGTNGGVSTLEMASAFATFGNGGKYFEAYSYYRVLDKDGNVILDNTEVKSEQAIKEKTASLMLDLLTSVTTKSYGTAYGSGVSGLQTFAKTGTTTDNCDKWICAGTPYYVCSIWYGYDYRSNLGGTSQQVRMILKSVFDEIHKGLSTKRTFNTVKNEIKN